jgi:hypothetical protein
MMQLPIIAPAPVVTEHAAVFRDLFENQCQFRHFQPYLSGLIVLPNKSLANMTRCILDSADKTGSSGSFVETILEKWEDSPLEFCEEGEPWNPVCESSSRP